MLPPIVFSIMQVEIKTFAFIFEHPVFVKSKINAETNVHSYSMKALGRSSLNFDCITHFLSVNKTDSLSK